MKTEFALGRESAPQRGLRNRLPVFAGVIAGILTAGSLTLIRAVPAAPVGAATDTASSVATAAPMASSAPTPSAGVDLAEVRARELQEYRAAIAQHMREPGDPTWAPASEKSLREFLNKLPTHDKYRVTLVDCRTNTCVAELRFPSHDVARKTWHSVLEASNPINCGTGITLEDPKPGEKSFDVSVIYYRATTSKQ